MPNLQPVRGAAVAVLLLFLGLGVAVDRGHVDVSDAHLYRVVVRHAVEDGTWTQLRYLPNVHPAFREHLPFGFWPSMAVSRLVGDGAVDWLARLWPVGTLAMLLWLAWKLGRPWAGVVAVLLLAFNESFLVYGRMLLLDPPLLFFTTGAVAPWLLGVPSWRGVAVSAGLTALAVMVKGPFGLLPLAAIGLASMVVDRRVRPVLFAAGTGVLAAVPVVVFLLSSDSSWWRGYVEGQLLASATGSREDGLTSPTYTAGVLLTRYWPGLPFAVLGMLRARKDRTRLLLTVSLLASLVALSLSGRQNIHHSYLLYPQLALLGGLALEPWLGEWLNKRERVVKTLPYVFAAAGIAVALAPFTLWKKTCPAREFQTELQAVAANEPLLVITEGNPWVAIGALAAEAGKTPWLFTGWDGAVPARFALVDAGAVERAPAGWKKEREAGGWAWLTFSSSAR